MLSAGASDSGLAAAAGQDMAVPRDHREPGTACRRIDGWLYMGAVVVFYLAVSSARPRFAFGRRHDRVLHCDVHLLLVASLAPSLRWSMADVPPDPPQRATRRGDYFVLQTPAGDGR